MADPNAVHPGPDEIELVKNGDVVDNVIVDLEVNTKPLDANEIAIVKESANSRDTLS